MSGTEKEVLRIGKQLDKMVSGEDDDHAAALDLLKTLKEQRITLDVLQISKIPFNKKKRTRIGMSVNNLRKQSSNQEVITLAKSLIKGWKKLLPADGNSSSNKSESKSTSNSQEEQEKETTESNGKPKRTGQPSSFGEDSVREKCRAMIAAALKTPIEEKILNELETSKFQDADVIAHEIEDCIYTEFVSTNMKYKNRVRSRVSNLQDAKNPMLRAKVLFGEITPEKMAKMTSEEMASKELKEMRSAFTKEAINEHQMATTGGTKSSLMKCHKCGKKNCTYNQVQTRSADEPMTTFVFCNECGNRWKFC